MQGHELFKIDFLSGLQYRM